MSFVKTLFSFLIFSIILMGCSKEEETFAPEQIACNPINLNINESAKRLVDEDNGYWVRDTIWHWKRNGDNLEIKFGYGCGDECSTVRKLQFLIQKECIVLTRDIGKVSDFYGGSSVQTYEIDFELQEFNDTRIIGKNMEMEFWVEFSEANRYK